MVKYIDYPNDESKRKNQSDVPIFDSPTPLREFLSTLPSDFSLVRQRLYIILGSYKSYTKKITEADLDSVPNSVKLSFLMVDYIKPNIISTFRR